MSLSTSEMSPADYAAVTGNNNAWGSDGAWWIIILFLFMFMGWGGGMWGNNTVAPNGPSGLNPAISYMQNAATQDDVQNGFDHAAVVNGITGISTTLNNGFANAEVSRCNSQANLLQTMNANNAAVLQQMNTMAYNQLGNANAAQAGVADLKYTVAQENANDRASLSASLAQIMADNRAQTQSILDKLCQQEIDAKNDTINQLRTQLDIANLAASQNQQTGQLMADNAAQTQSLVNQLRTPAPVPAYIVSNPNGCNCGNYSVGCCA